MDPLPLLAEKWGGQMILWSPISKSWGATGPLAPPFPTPLIYKCPWLSHIKLQLDQCGLSYMFNANEGVSKYAFKRRIKLRLNDIYNQNWQAEVYENQSCKNYRIFTDKKEFKPYLDIWPRSLWTLMLKFRCSNIKIPLVVGRYNNIPFDERKCNLCKDDLIGDDFHYIFGCSYFNEKRQNLIKR